MTTVAKTTVLVLHGYSQNASIFSKRLGALRKQCGKAVDFVFVDGPLILQPVDLVGMASPSASAESTLNALGASEAGLEKNEARAWWKWNDQKSEALGLAGSLETIRDVLKTRKFDGVFGFSQGATFAALLSALLERPHVYPPFLVDGKAPHPPFKFCVSVSGFRLSGAIADAIYEAPYLTPTLHIIGRNDVIIIEERSHRLVAISANARVEEHDGGHFVPSKGSWRKFLAAYLEDPSDNVPSPSLAMSSADNSGTATPMESETPQMKL
ncbi:serine hydrolase FSH [Mycena alexandri]|uniref:Serine hydrolase FSH n=1 Tax=Mycena alexandri TaxID=1745969 RepID=A0AAD6SP79_9AGAR|nr:serine hydrolase FSH [Mycena alexandri]